jgi:hypothetical protein
MDLNEKAGLFCSSIIGQFNSRTKVEGAKSGKDFGIDLEVTTEGGSIWFTFTKDEESHSFNVPIMFEENNVMLIEQNEVRRAVCPYLMKEEDLILDYYAVMHRIILDSASGIVSPNLMKKSPFVQRIVWSFANGNTSIIMYTLQRAINEVVNRMPLHETLLNSYIMNHRLIIIDPAFSELRSPEDRLLYQIEKSKIFFDRGWTPIGLADGNLSDKNYTLMCDIRHLTPFGMKYHNPQRNLYSTLGMKGDELPNVRSQSMENLMQGGIARKGWNMFTVFADIPDVFEDQILVDISHRSKFVTYEKRFQCYGLLKVKQGQKVKRGQTLSISDLATTKKFDIDCDSAKVIRITPSQVNVGGVKTAVFNVVIEYRRYLCEGMKFTNLHGNKGIIRMKDLGYMVDPRTGELRKIDIIVSAKSIKKRKNYGQVFEALLNNTTPEENKPIILDDYYEVPEETVLAVLNAHGLPEDGTWAGHTYHGPVEGVCGDIFWGVIASVEHSLWDREATVRQNTRNLRTAGLKLSHVEFRALTTRFGKDNPILNEVLTYAQGAGDLQEYMSILQSKKGILPEGLNVHHTYSKEINFVNQSAGTILGEEYLKGTIVDEDFEPNGFILQLPVAYQVLRDKDGKVTYEGAAQSVLPDDVAESFTYDKIYIPGSVMLRCWRHDNGKYGLNDVGVLVNNILVMAYRFAGEPEEVRHIQMLYRAIGNYFSKIADVMGTKGEVSRYGMAVRYPFSSKATATLSNRVPVNTVEIHKDMAQQLKVSNGDVVLVERFPCLGFMSIRPQKIMVTNDEMARYTIRVSGNSLCSMGLDFDGDVVYLASFHTPEARELLRAEWATPNEECYSVICQLNEKVGRPQVLNLNLGDYEISSFEPLTADTHAHIVELVTGVKSHTGPTIALAYNMMRILENSTVCDDQTMNVAIEYFLDRVGNTVFQQKHGLEKSLHQVVTDAICTGNIDTLEAEGFDRVTSQTIIDVIKEKAKTIGVNNLAQYHAKAKERGWSNVINRIVRQQNKVYYASRANLEATELLDHLEQPAVDIPSRILKDIMSGRIGAVKTKLEELLDLDALDGIDDDNSRDVAETLMGLVEQILTPAPKGVFDTAAKARMQSCFDREDFKSKTKIKPKPVNKMRECIEEVIRRKPCQASCSTAKCSLSDIPSPSAKMPVNHTDGLQDLT